MAYAKRQYMADRCSGAVSVLKDFDIIDCRVRAFMDGVRWQQYHQQAAAVRAKRRAKRS